MPKGIEGQLKKMSLQGKRPIDDDDDDDEDDDDYEPEEGDDDDEEDDEGIDLKGVVLNRVKHLRNMNEKVDAIHAEFMKERIALEEKYRVQKEELYEARRKILVGEVEPEKLPLEEGEEDDEAGATPPKGIPQFWMRALANHDAIADFIEEEDLPLLEKIINITCEYDEAYTSFTVSFYFEENEFMENTTLTKKYTIQPDLLDDNAMLDECFGTEIKWKEGKDLTVAEIKKKQKAKSGKNKGQVRTVTRKEPKRSFFNFFSDPIEEKDEEEEEEEEEDNVKLNFEQDYEIGYAIRRDIVPNAVAWFTGEAIPYEDGEDEDEEGEEGEEDGAEDGKGPKIVPDGKGGFTTVPGADGQQQECKQS